MMATKPNEEMGTNKLRERQDERIRGILQQTKSDADEGEKDLGHKTTVVSRTAGERNGREEIGHDNLEVNWQK